MMSFSHSPKQSYEPSLVERFLFKIIKQGPIPKHCAIIMDGNRRFAKRVLSGNISLGHEMGCSVFLRAVYMFLHCGIPEMTVYAFSQDNYKRPKVEVKNIMSLMWKALQEFEKNIDNMNEHGISFEAIGKWETIPDVRIAETLARLMLKTKGNNKLKINLALVYSGREEIVGCADAIVKGLEDGHVRPDDLNETIMQNMLTLRGTNPVDLLIRTSGETRLSDFLLWNTNDNTWLEFIDVSWPEFNSDHFLAAICNYQKHFLVSKPKYENIGFLLDNDRTISFVEQFKAKKWENIKALCEHGNK